MNTHCSYRFLFTTFDGGGNVAPIMSVVARLVERGHRVRVMSDRSNQQEADAAGAAFVPWRRAPSRETRLRELDPADWAADSPQQAIQEMARNFLCGMALPYARDTIAELEREPADLVVNFDMLLGVMAACESRGQKLALISTTVSMFPIPDVPPFGSGLIPARTDADRTLHMQVARDTVALFDSGLPALNEARAALELQPLEHVLDQGEAAVVHWIGTARAFDFAPPVLPDRLRYAGPLIRDPEWSVPWRSPWAATDRRPLVVIGFSTTFQNHAACLQRAIDACAELPVRVLVTLGGSIYEHEVQARENVHIVASAPHSVVMRDAALVITHGGHGTVITSLSHGVPLLVIPHGRDQGDIAARVVARGAGLSLPTSASVEDMQAAVRRLLEEDSFQHAAQRLRASIMAEVKSSTLIEELEALAAAPAGRHPDCQTASGAAVTRRATLKGLAASALSATIVGRSRTLRAGTSPRIDFGGLQRSIAGEVISIDSPKYSATRMAMTWNMRKSKRTPAAIVSVRSAKDVCAAVRFAASRGLKVAVRGGGHNYFGAPLRDGGLLLDLSALDALSIDAANLRASVQPAVKSGALVAALTPLGLAFPVGHCSDVAVSGYLLNGGIGWNVGEWGPACMSVRGIEMVTANGELVYADADHNRDLFWAARGAGPGFFGVITRYDIELQRLPRAIATRSVVFDVGSREEVGDWLSHLWAQAPPQVESVCVLTPRVQSPALSIALIAFADTESQARAWLAPIDSYPAGAKVLANTPQEPATFASLQALNDMDFPNGCRFAADHCWSNATPGRFLSAVSEQALAAASARSFVFMSPSVVRPDRVPAPADAVFSMFGSIYFGAYAFWDEPQQDAANSRWVRSVFRSADPLATGYYVGEADLAVSAQRASQCFAPAAWTRLMELRKRYDPTGVFFGYLDYV